MENNTDIKQPQITIEDLYNMEIKERQEMDWTDKNKINEMLERDKAHRIEARKILSMGALTKGLDFHHAALIFQHGDNSNDFKLAHELADKAVKLGDETAKWLYAATLDRWLLSEGKVQKFGTQFKDENGVISMAPLDPNISDEERAQWNLPPLAEAVQGYKDKYGIK